MPHSPSASTSSPIAGPLPACAQAHVSAADRKRRTRRLILLGSYIDSVSQADPEAMTRLMKGLDKFLELDQDRALFDLAPKPKDAWEATTRCLLNYYGRAA